jgi:NAD(P)H-dependent FMN reductase
MKHHYAILYGSVRSGRLGIRVARFFEKQLTKRGHSVTLIDPAEYDLPLLDKMYKEYEEGKAPDNLERIAEALRKADGYVIVAGEYNHTLPPALTNLMDYFQGEYLFKPSAIATYSYGSFAGVRSAMAARPFLAELGTPSIPSLFPVANVHEAMEEDGTASDDKYLRYADRFLSELEWYTEALGRQRAEGTPY